MEELTIHDDWFTRHVPEWEKYLGHLKGKPHLKYLEIGVWEGCSLCWMLQNILTDPTSEAIGIDSFEGNPENGKLGYEDDVEITLWANIRKIKCENRVRVMRDRSSSALPRLSIWNERFDVIYVDGSHHPKDLIVDIVLSWPLLKSGGHMILDDYKLKSPELGIFPCHAVNAFYNIFKSDLIECHREWQVIWRKI